ncbi:MAG: SGNH/GDSL hydrolase family protein [Selenomonadaceae bacterium]|nr:SGNH/GDSL hydrolase family protein [Selenomonadaceae bacterium]
MTLKIIPIIFAGILSLLNVQFKHDAPFQKINLESQTSIDAQNLKVSDVKLAALTNTSTSTENSYSVNARPIDATPVETDIRTVRLTWSAVPYAVRYRISYADQNVISPTTGVEIGINVADEIFKVTALNFDNEVVAEDVPILSTEINPKSVRTTSEFDKMSYPPLYLVYSWIPANDAAYYEIRLIKDGEVLRHFFTDIKNKNENFDFYDDNPVTESGEYYWQVRGFSADDVAVTDWSEKNAGNSFTVTKPTHFAAIGDSITHGGSVTVTPAQVLCNWETYCSFPVKNLGRSGDTTGQILARFDEDVLAFQPEVLFIMAGVNDFRSGYIGSYSTDNLNEILERCEVYGIKPVFITPTPLNPALINKVKSVRMPPNDWREQRKYICDWIRKQKYFIDISDEVTDAEGNLHAYLTTDGLHPNAEGKKIIGRAVEDWIIANSK